MADDQATKPSESADSDQPKLLQRRVDLPVEGALAKNVPAPSFLKRIGGYFAGSWHELREVRWPTRRATLGLTVAVILFSLILAAFVLALDFGFEQLFKRIIL